MNEPKAQQEPSMEEILASIRRIISEDGPQDGAKEEAETDPAEAASAPVEPEPAEEPGESGVDPEFEPQPEPESEDEDDVLELTEIVDEAPESGAPEPESEPPAVAQEAPAPEPLSSSPPPTPAAAPASLESGLLSAPAAGSAQAQLSSLVAAVDKAQGGTPIGVGNRTIEDLVKEVMRPMIKEWLDANLPGLTERIVRREVERLARRAEGDD